MTERKSRKTGRSTELSRDAIKYIAVFAMLLNHIANLFFRESTIEYLVFTDIGYLTILIMCFFLVEGYRYTHSVKKYGERLLIFAFLSEIPYRLAFEKDTDFQPGSCNVLFTLLICFCLIHVISAATDGQTKAILIFLLLCAGGFCDWGFLAPVFTILFIWAEGSAERQKTVFLLDALLLGADCFVSGAFEGAWMTGLLNAAGGMTAALLAGVLILYCYEKEKKKHRGKWAKWFFYWFYPVHLMILTAVRAAIS